MKPTITSDIQTKNTLLLEKNNRHFVISNKRPCTFYESLFVYFEHRHIALCEDRESVVRWVSGGGKRLCAVAAAEA